MFIKSYLIRTYLKSHLRFYSTKEATKNSSKYTSTINLPQTNFPARLTASKRRDIEKDINERCNSNLYAYQREHNVSPEFILHDGPPYANGDLHMGHAVNKILKDITLRHHVVNGVRVHYKPGWDCHGLPIELKAMNGGKNVDPLEIRAKSRKFAASTIQKQKQEFQSWGVLADWITDKNIYKTYDSTFIENQLHVFFQLFKKTLVYRDLKPVHWSPSSKTALAEAELEYDNNHISPSIVLRLRLSNLPGDIKLETSSNHYALIWTTTPWTLPSNQAVCFNPKLTYCWIKLKNDEENLYLVASSLIQEVENFLGQTIVKVSELSGDSLNSVTYFHPIENNLELPFLSSNHVQDNKGTGLVHTSPAHGPEDFLVSLANNISIKCYVDEDGKYLESAPAFLKGKFVLTEGNYSVINYLQKDILHEGKITHSHPIDWRTKQPVIVRASNQWFIDTNKLKEKSVEEISKVHIYPKTQAEINKNMLITQLEKRPYWCISRQRSWGVPIPVFYDKSLEKTIINEELVKHICTLLRKESNMDFWWSRSVEELIPKSVVQKMGLDIQNIEKGNDIFDIWFDSGISWYNALDDQKVADLYLEGSDQFTGWFQSSLLTSIALRNRAPYKSIFVHGFAVDEKGHKMSKSLGNVILPRDIIKTYGTDVLRWWVATHGTQHSSIIVSENLLKSSAESLSKIRRILRYLNGVIDQRNENSNIDESKLKYLDKYFLNQLWEFENKIHQFYKSYDYNRVITFLQNFITNQLSATYLHLTKDRLYCDSDEEFAIVQKILTQTYEILCKAIWPITPFMVEESWSYYDSDPFYKNRVKSIENYKNLETDHIMNIISDLRHRLNQGANDVNTWTLNIQIKCSEKILELLQKVHPKVNDVSEASELCELLQVSSVVLLPGDTCDCELEIVSTTSNLCPRCRRFSTENQNLCHRCEQILLSKNTV